MAQELTAGLRAPAFSLARDGGGSVSLSDFGGRPVVLFFYPNADTPGCTREAQAFSALREAFDQAGAGIIGVSADPIEAQDKFKRKYDLSIPLASDPTHEMLTEYGVWVEKSMYGRKYMGIERATFLVGPDSGLVRIWRKVKVEGHAEEVLAAVRALAIKKAT